MRHELSPKADHWVEKLTGCYHAFHKLFLCHNSFTVPVLLAKDVTNAQLPSTEPVLGHQSPLIKVKTVTSLFLIKSIIWIMLSIIWLTAKSTWKRHIYSNTWHIHTHDTNSINNNQSSTVYWELTIITYFACTNRQDITT